MSITVKLSAYEKAVNTLNKLPLEQDRIFTAAFDELKMQRDHARHLLGEVLAVLNGDGGHAVQELGWEDATKRGLARYHDMLARAAGCVTYPCDCIYPRDGHADPNCGACNGLGAITKTEYGA